MTLLLLAFTFAALEWLAEHKESQRGIYLTKPTMMVALIAWVLVSNSLLDGGNVFPRLWFVIGLVFCLGGDVFLMLPERFFLPGLVSFLLGHVFYILAFGHLFPPQGSFWPALAVVVILLVLGVIIYRKLDQGMTASGNERMRVPVLVYSVVISIMLYAALTRGLGGRWHTTSAIWVGVGAALFYLSDILNAWRRFVGNFPNARLVIMMTYHLGQIGLALGMVLQ